MEGFTKFISTAPVLATAWMGVTAVILIGANVLFPDQLYFPL